MDLNPSNEEAWDVYEERGLNPYATSYTASTVVPDTIPQWLTDQYGD